MTVVDADTPWHPPHDTVSDSVRGRHLFQLPRSELGRSVGAGHDLKGAPPQGLAFWRFPLRRQPTQLECFPVLYAFCFFWYAVFFVGWSEGDLVSRRSCCTSLSLDLDKTKLSMSRALPQRRSRQASHKPSVPLGLAQVLWMKFSFLLPFVFSGQGIT